MYVCIYVCLYVYETIFLHSKWANWAWQKRMTTMRFDSVTDNVLLFQLIN